jgi:hypothetical protein
MFNLIVSGFAVLGVIWAWKMGWFQKAYAWVKSKFSKTPAPMASAAASDPSESSRTGRPHAASFKNTKDLNNGKTKPWAE